MLHCYVVRYTPTATDDESLSKHTKNTLASEDCYKYETVYVLKPSIHAVSVYSSSICDMSAKRASHCIKAYAVCNQNALTQT